MPSGIESPLEWSSNGSVRLLPSGPIHGSVRPPGSKSITNRAVLCAALAQGTSHLRGVLTSEDTEVMIDSWLKLGLKVDWNKIQQTLSIQGCAGKLPVRECDLFVANSGTTLRFMTAALAACHGEYRLSGVPRMHQRPAGDLIAGLRQLGADIESTNNEHPGCPPIRVRADGLMGGKSVVSGSVSSQFLSGLMMASPYAQSPVTLEVEGNLVSRPYVTMTTKVMESFGVCIDEPARNRFFIAAPQIYQATQYDIEPDASAASYYFGIAAISGGSIRVEGLHRNSLQGDVGFVSVLEKMGCSAKYGEAFIEVQGGELHGIDVDMNEMSDTVQTLAAVALFAKGTTRVRGVAHNRHKETDRIGDLARELRKMGAVVDEFEDGLAIAPPQSIQPCTVETYNDHRMAMSLALVGLRAPGIWITHPECTEKTYPDYFEDVARLIAK